MSTFANVLLAKGSKPDFTRAGKIIKLMNSRVDNRSIRMPKIFDLTAVEWPEDDEDFWPKPKPSEFQYYTPHHFGGRTQPVRFSIATASLADEELSDDELPDAQLRSLQPQHSGFFGWMRGLFGGRQGGDGKAIPVRTIGEQHVKDDLGWIPSVKDWLKHLDVQPWMGRTVYRPSQGER
ncbi:MAG: hypothetical protein AAGC70_10940 [Pseudomonadota bacterium]